MLTLFQKAICKIDRQSSFFDYDISGVKRMSGKTANPKYEYHQTGLNIKATTDSSYPDSSISLTTIFLCEPSKK